MVEEDIHSEDLSKNINWRDREAVLKALKVCGIREANLLEAAAAIHEFRWFDPQRWPKFFKQT